MVDVINRDYVDYKTIREDFSTFTLENNLVLKLKAVLTGIYNEKDDADGKIHGHVTTNLVARVETPKNFDVSNLIEVEHESAVTDDDITNSLEVTEKNQIVNVYETEKSFIIIGIDVEKIAMTDKKFKDGIPALRFTHIMAQGNAPKPFAEKPNPDDIKTVKSEQ